MEKPKPERPKSAAPVAVGLALCDYVIQEEGTKKVSPIGIFTGMGVERFPSDPQPFTAFATLTDGVGDARIQLVVKRLDTGDEIYTWEAPIHFVDRLAVVNFRFRLRRCSFPAPGWYLFTLFIDGDWIAQRRLSVYLTGARS